MQGQVRIEGLEAALDAMQAAFPNNPKKQRQILNATMAAAGRKTILPMAKTLAKVGDGSGALSQSLNFRFRSLTFSRRRSKAAGIYLSPIRYDPKAMMMYSRHYYGAVAKGRNVIDGIRHGHLIEFGTAHHSARPFLWPAAEAQQGAYIAIFAATMRKKIDAAVRRARKRKAAR